MLGLLGSQHSVSGLENETFLSLWVGAGVGAGSGLDCGAGAGVEGCSRRATSRREPVAVLLWGRRWLCREVLALVAPMTSGCTDSKGLELVSDSSRVGMPG